MADLKIGTTIGGSVAWHQGNFPLIPASNDLYYKTYKIYTEWNKPQAADNDFVSKAQGGVYAKSVEFTEGLTFPDKDSYKIKIAKNLNTNPMFAYSACMTLKTSFALENESKQPFIIFNPALGGDRLTVMGNILADQLYDPSGRVFSPGNAPNKTQVGLGNVTNDAQVKLASATEQAITGNGVSAMFFRATQPATEASHVTRLDQVIVKNTIIDFGTY